MKIWTSISWSVVKQCRNVKCYECKSELATAGLLNVLRGFCNTVYDLSPLICTVWVLFMPLVISLYCNKGLRFRPQNRLLFVCGHQGTLSHSFSLLSFCYSMSVPVQLAVFCLPHLPPAHPTVCRADEDNNARWEANTDKLGNKHSLTVFSKSSVYTSELRNQDIKCKLGFTELDLHQHK